MDFCPKPWEHLEIDPNGQVYVCCPGWLTTPIGNAFTADLLDLWNGHTAQKIRESIISHAFTYCGACPWPAGEGPRTHSIIRRAEYANRAEPLIAPRVSVLNLAYDRTCNLACPSCRSSIIVATGAVYEKAAQLQQRVLDSGVLDVTDTLYLTGSGDPFASRLYRDLLRSLDPARYPKLKIKLHTNGLLFTPAAWEALGPIRARVKIVEVSIDAAYAGTYRANRGGDWATLAENLVFIADDLRKTSQIDELQLSFVVQENNFAEMSDFVHSSERVAADTVLFTALRNWGTYTPADYAARAVHLPAHPNFSTFVSVLRRLKAATALHAAPRVLFAGLDSVPSPRRSLPVT